MTSDAPREHNQWVRRCSVYVGVWRWSHWWSYLTTTGPCWVALTPLVTTSPQTDDDMKAAKLGGPGPNAVFSPSSEQRNHFSHPSFGPRLYKSEASALTESIRTHSPALIWWACWVEWVQRKQWQPKCIQTFSSFCCFSSSHSKSQHARGSRCVSSCIDLILFFFWVILVAGGLIITYPLSFMTLDQHSPLLDYTTHLSLSGLVGTVQLMLVLILISFNITVPISALVNYKAIFLILKPLMNGGWVWINRSRSLEHFIID